jgi:hypothetical protein
MKETGIDFLHICAKWAQIVLYQPPFDCAEAWERTGHRLLPRPLLANFQAFRVTGRCNNVVTVAKGYFQSLHAQKELHNRCELFLNHGERPNFGRTPSSL